MVAVRADRELLLCNRAPQASEKWPYRNLGLYDPIPEVNGWQLWGLALGTTGSTLNPGSDPGVTPAIRSSAHRTTRATMHLSRRGPETRAAGGTEMTVGELIALLSDCDEEAEVRIMS